MRRLITRTRNQQGATRDNGGGGGTAETLLVVGLIAVFVVVLGAFLYFVFTG